MATRNKGLHTTSAAQRSAYKRKIGKGRWVVSTWDNNKNVWIDSHMVDYYKALEFVRMHRESVVSGRIEGKL